MEKPSRHYLNQKIKVKSAVMGQIDNISWYATLRDIIPMIVHKHKLGDIIQNKWTMLCNNVKDMKKGGTFQIKEATDVTNRCKVWLFYY